MSVLLVLATSFCTSGILFFALSVLPFSARIIIIVLFLLDRSRLEKTARVVSTMNIRVHRSSNWEEDELYLPAKYRVVVVVAT